MANKSTIIYLYSTHTHHFNGHFSVKPGLAGCPLIIRGVWCKCLWGGCPSSRPTNIIKALKD